MSDYSKPGQQRFVYAGMCTVCSPDAQPQGKVPLAINVHGYLADAITPRLPQSSALVTLVPSAAIHSLRRMNDNTNTVTTTAYGPAATGTGTDHSVVGGIAWSNPGNITSPDGSYASVSLSASAGNVSQGPNSNASGSQTTLLLKQSWSGLPTGPTYAVAAGFFSDAYTLDSQTLTLSNYGFTIPSNATIKGIQVNLTHSASIASVVADTIIQLVKGSPVGSNRASGSSWPTSPTGVTYGSNVDLWGTTWSPADINNNNFGIAIACSGSDEAHVYSARVSSVTITVTYTVPAGAGLSDLLQATNFGFSIPGGYTISGVQVDVLCYQTSHGNTVTFQLLKGGVLTGSTKLNLGFPGGPPAAYFSLGGAGDLWGATLAPSDVNAANFGISLQATQTTGNSQLFVDFIRVTVWAYSASPTTGYVLISGSADKVFVGTTQVQSGMSQNRLAMVPFRPNNSVRPWMYIGDSAKMIKVSSDGTTYKLGIKEPQTVPTLATAGAGPLTGTISYAYSYRSSATGAQSNLSPTAAGNTISAASNAILVTCTASADTQADLIDIWRFDAGLLAYTYIGTTPNSSPAFTDNLSDVTVQANQQATIDNFEPFPSIDTPKAGTLTVSAGPYTGTVTCTWASGDKFNLNWLPNTIVTLGSGSGATNVTLFARPTSGTVFVGVIQPSGATLANGTYSFSIPAASLAAQPLPALWGPTDNAAYMFACQDPLRPGTLYFTKGNQPDSAPQTNSLEMTSPSEPLIGGCIVGGLGLVMSTERGWLIYPNFSQATASIIGVVGSVFTTVPTITERGLWCKDGICVDGGGNVYFITKDGIRKSPGGTGSESITDDIDNLFPHEGQQQLPYTIGGYTISPPNYNSPNGMCLRFSQGYVYFDYTGLDGTGHTLKYQVVRGAWSVEQYAATVTVHADNEGQGTSGSPPLPAIGPLLGCTDGTIRQLSSTATETSSTVVVLTPSVGGITRADKHFGDIYVEHSVPSSGTAFSVVLWQNRYAQSVSGILSPSTLTTPALNRSNVTIDLNSGSGLYAKDIALVFTAPLQAPGLAQDGTTQEYLALYLWEPTLIEQPDTTLARVTDWDDGGTNRAKLVQGVIIHADTNNVPKIIAVQSADDLSINSLAEMGSTGVAFSVQQNKAFSLASPFVAHRMRLVPQDSVPWHLWDVEWIYTLYPEQAQEWHTPFTAHGLKGWQHVKEINVEYASINPVSFTIVTDTGFIGAAITLPATGGAVLKQLITIPPFKGKMFSYNFTSVSPFPLWKEDLEVKAGEWGRTDSYRIVKPFGGQSNTEAEV